MDEEKKIITRDGDWNHADEMVIENVNRNLGQYCIPSVSRLFSCWDRISFWSSSLAVLTCSPSVAGLFLFSHEVFPHPLDMSLAPT